MCNVLDHGFDAPLGLENSDATQKRSFHIASYEGCILLAYAVRRRPKARFAYSVPQDSLARK
ncbi:hypothetical protein X797_010119 [Metarhizium robertsii]|uniref:Uncharacterized protein n=1 Tax=Metarhizium robertsii TaxID=568076 RepID=A0A0A1UPJ4_9HYPO|nr:hypothetical protein X797_010119 [Metarhizium robertsii]